MNDLGKASPKMQFMHTIMHEMQKGTKYNKRSVEALGLSFGLNDQTEIKELTELAVVHICRAIAYDGQLSLRGKFDQIVEVYKNQVNLSHRTSRSTLLQQYSTPAPVAFMAGFFAGLQDGYRLTVGEPEYFEPSAGNGMLTIAGAPEFFTVNEIDDVRRANLKCQNFAQVSRLDASSPFDPSYQKRYDAVITNPPFGSLDQTVEVDGFKIRNLDHAMAINALDTMADNGRAAIIIGGHHSWDTRGRLTMGKNRWFFNYLYSRYNVSDVLQIPGEMFARMGTKFPTRLILIAGRKPSPTGVAPLRSGLDVKIKSFDHLFERVTMAYNMVKGIKDNQDDLLLAEAEAEALLLLLQFREEGLEGPYRPSSDTCMVLDTMVPDSMDAEIHAALARVRQEIGIPLEEYVRDRMGYANAADLCDALAAEQVDAVALAIYNIEFRGQGMIIGDQTGIGKGRVAASMIRFGVNMGMQPIFISEKANLFSDLYRDLKAIGAGQLVPFIVNTRDAKSHIKDSDGTIIYKAPTKAEQDEIFQGQMVPHNYDFIVATYTQFNADPEKGGSPKQHFLKAIGADNLLVLDESHNASGASQTGVFLQEVVRKSLGVTFLSATYAKRPANMPVYGMKTAMSDANLSPADLTKAIESGGVALQEIVSAQLVSEGQMIRRERSFEGIEVNYMTLDENAAQFGLPNKEAEHKATSDAITDIMRDIIKFQKEGVRPIVKDMDKQLAKEGEEIKITGGTSEAGIDNPPYFSKVFQIIHQMLMAIKAEATAELAIKRLREGKKPVIAFASTMEAFFSDLITPEGFDATQGDVVRADFTSILQRGLDSVRRITTTDHTGEKIIEVLELNELSSEAQAFYHRISKRIRTVTSGITLSPIDHIKQLIEAEGYSVAEVTGRSRMIHLDLDTMNPREEVTASGELVTKGKITGTLLRRPRINVNDAFRKFNDNEVDVLMINQSGSTGASAHAVPTDKVPASEVKQRVMIVLQAELDINTEVQKRGRVNRTGQILKPIYDYVISAIPAEKRLMMMLQKKLKSLDANTSSNQKQSEALLKTDDFLNKYGDKVVTDYLGDEPLMNEILGDPIKVEPEGRFKANKQMAHLASGRVAVLSAQDQDLFYNEVLRRYDEYIGQLKQEGEYDLEVEIMDLQAKTVEKHPSIIGVTNNSVFGNDTILEKVEAKNLRKPFTQAELAMQISNALGAVNAQTQKEGLQLEFSTLNQQLENQERQREEVRHEKALEHVPKERIFKKIEDADELLEAYEVRKTELTSAHVDNLRKIKTKYQARLTYMGGLLKFFYVGRSLSIPGGSTEGEEQFYDGVFLGFSIDRSKPNPFTASNVKLRIAVASAVKLLTIPASGDYKARILAIKGATNSTESESRELVNNWDVRTTEQRRDWYLRYIATGNLLQALSKYKGKLIAYTTRSGDTKKGLLLPENWLPDRKEAGEVRIPLIKAIRIFASLPVGKLVNTNAGVGFVRKALDMFEVYVPASNKKGAKYYQDEDLLELVEDQFEKTSNNMVAQLAPSKLEEFLTQLQEKFSDSITLSEEEFLRIKDEIPKRKPKSIRRLQSHANDELFLAEAEAEALLLILAFGKAA